MDSYSQDCIDNNKENEVKPIVFPDGSIQLDHSDISLTSCSLFISIDINHQDGFYYEVFFRDNKYKVLKTKNIELYECSSGKDNHFIWEISDVNPGEEYNINCISKAPSGEMKPLCLTYKLVAPCTRPGLSPLLLKSKSRKDIVLKWKIPRNNGKEIDGYTIKMSDGYMNIPENVELTTTLVEKAKVKECKSPKLKSGWYYAFQIISFNACGETVNPIQWFQTQASVPSAPNPPMIVAVQHDSISLEWKELTQEEMNGSVVDGYFLQMNEGNNGWHAVYSDSKPFTTIEHLKDRTSYQFRLCAHNAEGNGPYSSVIEYIGKPPAPHLQPIQMSKRQGKNIVTISWECDSTTKDITDRYLVQIQRSKDQSIEIQQECTSSPLSISTLLPGCSYSVSIKSHSTGGWSDFSKGLSFITPSTIPSLLTAPTIESNVIIKDENYSINTNVNWKEGESNGASIDSYIIEMKVIDYEQQQQQINAIKLLSKRPEEVVDTTSLSVGQSCKLIGKDDLYWVYSIEESKVRLLNTQMNKKEYVIIDSSQVIPLSYSFPSSKTISIPSKDLLSSYSLHSVLSSPSSMKWTSIQEISTLSTTISNLLPNSSYSLHVLPHNSCGLATSTVDCSFITPPGPLPIPQLPSIVSITSSSIELDCSPSANYDYRGNNPSNIEVYIECDKTQTGIMECIYHGKEFHQRFDNLKSGSIYHIRIAYTNNNGNSPFSSILSIATKPSSPEPPRSIHIGSLDSVYDPLTFACIEWEAPYSDNGSEILQYHIEMANMNNLNKGSSNKNQYTKVGVTKECSILLHDLLPGGLYSLRLQCENQYGLSNVTPPYQFRTGCLPPDQMEPPILARKPTEKSATIRWSEPTTNGSAILGYHIHIDPINRDYSVSSEARSQVINKLIGNTEYSVTIVAVNSVGQSKPSEALIFKTESHSVGAPFTSSFNPIQKIDNTVIISWSEADCNGSTIQKYQLLESHGIIYEGIERKYSFIPEIGKQYSFQVRAVNVIGAGDLSEACTVYIPPPMEEKKIVKTKVARDQKAIGQGFNSEKNERVEAILGKHNKKRFAQLRLWWKENQIFVFLIIFIWVSIYLFKPM